MSPTFANAVRRDLGLGILLVSFVCLVTFMFSFLGTILCATLFGMMVGFGKKWKWRTVGVSLTFPGLLLVSMHIHPQSGPSWSDSIRLASICFGTFWATYLATRGLFLLEGGRHGQPPVRSEPVQQKPAQPWHDVTLEELQGAWSQEIVLPDGQVGRRAIQVDGNEVTMTVVHLDGKPRLLARGQLHLAKPVRS